jgi:triosephosphate isomerase
MANEVFRNYHYEKSGGHWRKVKAEPGTPGAIRPFLAGNWKMNLTPRAGIAHIARLFDLCRGVSDVDFGVAPPYTGLAAAREFMKPDFLRAEYDLGSNVSLLAQDVFFEAKGAFTGEISAEMLASMGIDKVIIGHSDRRANMGKYYRLGRSAAKRLSADALAAAMNKQKARPDADPKMVAALERLTSGADQDLLDGLTAFLEAELNARSGESNEAVQRKVQAALSQNLDVVLCIGENLEAREGGETFKLLERQIRSGFEGVSAAQMDKMVIAYEPVWAIGAGAKPASPDLIAEVHAYIRGLLATVLGEDVAAKLRVLYGGNVKPDNIAEIMAIDNVDGALVGGASLKAVDFSQIVKFGL